MNASERLTVNMTPDVKRGVEAKAKEEGRSFSSVVNRALVAYLKRPQKKA